jgi:hypothetical protein
MSRRSRNACKNGELEPLNPFISTLLNLQLFPSVGVVSLASSFVVIDPPAVKGKAAKRQQQPLPTEQELEALKQGCALKIEISQHTVRVYSIHHIYGTRAGAKAAVADLAIRQGVLDFIKHANGQTEPMVFINELDGDASENLNRDVIAETAEPEKEVTIDATAVNVTLKRHQIPLNAMTLQGFTNALPKPLPETPGLKPIGDGNPVGWINTAVQMARGSKMGLMWTYLSNAKLSCTS